METKSDIKISGKVNISLRQRKRNVCYEKMSREV